MQGTQLYILAVDATGLQLDATGRIISLASGYEIPTSARLAQHDLAYGWGNHASAGYAAGSHNHATSDITSGTFADARIAATNVTQHVAAIDHNSLLNYSSSQHIDWTSSTDNFATTGTLASGNATITGTVSATGSGTFGSRVHASGPTGSGVEVDSTTAAAVGNIAYYDTRMFIIEPSPSTAETFPIVARQRFGFQTSVQKPNVEATWRMQLFYGSALATVFFVTGAGTTIYTPLDVTQGFGCNGATAQTAYTLPAAATDLTTTMALANAIAAALKANGTCA